MNFGLLAHFPAFWILSLRLLAFWSLQNLPWQQRTLHFGRFEYKAAFSSIFSYERLDFNLFLWLSNGKKLNFEFSTDSSHFCKYTKKIFSSKFPIFLFFRKYTYRLAVCRSWDLWDTIRTQPSLACFSERDYSWRIPPGFSPEKLLEAGKMFEGE